MRSMFLLVVLLFSLTGPALADPPPGRGGGREGGAQSENSNSGNKPASSGKESKPVKIPKDERIARETVKRHQAISLEALTALVARSTKGRMLDVELVWLGGAYVYQVTVLEADGQLRKIHYDARTGALKGRL